jgi:hypothetical protein
VHGVVSFGKLSIDVLKFGGDQAKPAHFQPAHGFPDETTLNAVGFD